MWFDSDIVETDTRVVETIYGALVSIMSLSNSKYVG